MSIFVVPVTVVLLLLTFDFVMPSSDPAAIFCESVCWVENALADQCKEDTGCNIETQRFRQYLRCARPCETQAASCDMTCREHFQDTIGECIPECTDVDTYEDCMGNCFTHRALRIKYRNRSNSLLRRIGTRPPLPPGASNRSNNRLSPPVPPS